MNAARVSLTYYNTILGRLLHLGYLNMEAEGTLGLVQCTLSLINMHVLPFKGFAPETSYTYTALHNMKRV